MVRAILTGVLAVACFACSVRSSAVPESRGTAEGLQAGVESDSADTSQVVYTVRPEMLNEREVERTLERSYPMDLKER